MSSNTPPPEHEGQDQGSQPGGADPYRGGGQPPQQPHQGGEPGQPGSGGYPQQGGYGSHQGGYGSQQGGYPAQGGPSQGGPSPYGGQDAGYPQHGGYPGQGGQGGYPQQGGYGPQQGGYGPQQGGYGPQQGGYPEQSGYPPYGGHGGGFGPGGPGDQPHSGGSAKRGLFAGSVLGLVVAMVAGVAALGAVGYGLYKWDPMSWFSSGPQAAEAIPADALFYVGVDLDPSAQQKINAVQFLNHFPAFQERVGIDDASSDVRKTIVEKLLESSPCEGISYDADVAPWLGDKFGVAGMKSADGGEPAPVFAMQVTDTGKADDALAQLTTCGGGDPTAGYAFTGDYVLVAETQELADSFADASERGSLADEGDFSADMDSLGDLGVATMWVDIAATVDAFGEPVDMMGTGAAGLASTYERAAATVRFESDSAEVAVSVYGDTADIDHGDNQVVDLPESTALAVSEAGGAERLDASWDSIMEAGRNQGVDIESQLQQFEQQTGLSLPDDLATVLGENVMFALDADGLTSEAIQAEDPTQINLGVRFTNDPDALNAVYDKLLALVQDSLGGDVPFAKADLDDGIVIASNDGYADELGELGGGLGDSDAFTAVVDDAADKEFVLFFNFDSIEDQVLDAAANEGAPAEIVDNLRPFEALGYSQHVDGDYLKGSLQISVND